MRNQQQLDLIDQVPKKVSNRSSKRNVQELPLIPDKLYFSISEVGKLCLLKPHVLRYWEQEFPQLSPNKRKGQRRFYQRRDILLVRKIKNLLYEEGYTIEGARAKLEEDKKKDSPQKSFNSSGLVQDAIVQLKGIVAELERA